jgi:hypothetical protein
VAAVLAAGGLSAGCAGTPDGGGNPPPAGAGAATQAPPSFADAAADAAANQIDNTATGIVPREQVYDGGHIIEVLQLAYDGQQPALAATDGRNPVIDEINDNIEATVYGDYDTASGPDSWADIRSYPFTSAEYLQIVTTGIVYPTYGTEGNVQSWVFDRQANVWVQPEQVYAEAGLVGDALTEAVTAAFVPDSDAESVSGVEPSGFRYVQGPDGWIPEFLLKITVANAQAEPWDGLFAYQPADAAGPALIKLNAECLFDPADMDTMDRPLMYARGGGAEDAEGTGGLWIRLPSYADVAQTGGGIDDAGNRWEEYVDDAGTVAVSIHRASAVAATDPVEIEAQVTGAVDAVDRETWRLEASPEASEAYTYPVHVFEYDAGANEDLRSHLGFYIQTDAGGFVLDCSIPADPWDEGHALAEDWMKHLELVDLS